MDTNPLDCERAAEDTGLFRESADLMDGLVWSQSWIDLRNTRVRDGSLFLHLPQAAFIQQDFPSVFLGNKAIGLDDRKHAGSGHPAGLAHASIF